jgi:hypothetical protein
MHRIFWLENLKGRNLLEELGADMNIILKCILGKDDVKMQLAQDWDQWRDLVNTVMKLRVS